MSSLLILSILTQFLNIDFIKTEAEAKHFHYLCKSLNFKY